MDQTSETILSSNPVPERNVVQIKNMTKRYNNNSPILNNFSMDVKQGDIYCLLGSSGCGKSTAISCIVGITDWEGGDVYLFGEKPNAKNIEHMKRNIGYMPQELALYDRLTIFEAIRLYGKLSGLSKIETSTRFKFLKTLRELPETDKLLHKLSGGQRRRVSMALALVHSPKLLILDEPTVGLDPLLRHKVWEYLRNIASASGTTILVTTHYIEEARHSNMIGVIRNGRLIVQESPEKLMDRFGCELLEEIVLILCRNDENSSVSQSVDEVYVDEVENTPEIVTEESTHISHLDSLVKPKSDYSGSSCWDSMKRCHALCVVFMLSILRLPT